MKRRRASSALLLWLYSSSVLASLAKDENTFIAVETFIAYAYVQKYVRLRGSSFGRVVRPSGHL